MGIARYPALDFGEHASHRPLALQSMAYLAVAVAILCASCVFFLLCQRDNSRFLAISSPLKAAAAKPAVRPAPIPAATPQTASTLPAPAGPMPVVAPQRVEFKVHRSRAFQTVGPIKLRLVRINLRHSNADLSLLVNGRRVDKRQIALDKPFQVPPTRTTGHAIEIVLQGLTKESVSGYVSTL